MPTERQYFVYILANKMRRLYVGVTNDLERRVWEHRTKAAEAFRSLQHRPPRLVRVYRSGHGRHRRREGVKASRRDKKVKLIETDNPGWVDLARDWFG